MLFALSAVSPAFAQHSKGGKKSYGKSSKNSGYRIIRRGGRRGSQKRTSPKITDSPIVFTGVLESKNDKLAISGNDMPLEVDKGLSMLAKKHVGKEVQVTGTKITIDGKSKVKVKLIRAIASTKS